MNVIISHIAFAREKGRNPKSKVDLTWCEGYECARKDNAAAMELMQSGIDKLRAKQTSTPAQKVYACAGLQKDQTKRKVGHETR